MKMSTLAHSLLAISLPFSAMAANSHTIKQSKQVRQQQKLMMQDSDQQLPFAEIQQFVTAIAAIKHYYIKKQTNERLFDHAISGMVSALDPHSSYLNQQALKSLTSSVKGAYTGIGIEITTDKGLLKVVSPIDGTPAYKAGIQPGDVIVKINGKLVSDITTLDAIKRIKGKPGTTVALTILRKGADKPQIIQVQRQKIKVNSVKSSLISGHYGYIRITFFQDNVTSDLHKAIRKIQKQTHGKLYGLILDLRNNPGGVLQVSAKVADTFLNAETLNRKYKDIIVYTKGRIKQGNITLKAHTGDMTHGVPMVVLINRGSASASEIVAGALQDYRRAVIMGTRSFGKGSVQSIIPISENTAIKITTALYHTPNGRVIQAKGITPNVIVPALKVDANDIDNFISVDEADYENAIDTDEVTNQKEEASTKAMRKADMALAKKDYQKYEALLMLRGMHAVRKTS